MHPIHPLKRNAALPRASKRETSPRHGLLKIIGRSSGFRIVLRLRLPE
jgi:hypothetical protein